VHVGGGFSGCGGDSVSGVFRVSEDLEGWFAPKRGGFALPYWLHGGLKTRFFVAMVGLGFNLFTLDSMGGKVGGGIFSPRANARIGIHKGAFYVDVMGGVQRRWEWKIDDITMFQAGVTVGWVDDLASVRR
jgi:hypothetical protein